MAEADLKAKEGDVSAERLPGTRPRIIATTDGEIDDRCSMVRFLLYANEWDIEGIVYCSSKFHWKGHNWAGEEWIEGQIDLYASFYDTLKQHAPGLESGTGGAGRKQPGFESGTGGAGRKQPGFPTPQELKDLTSVGNIDNVGEMEKETPGSNRIVEVLLDSKPGPVYLQAWGGTNTIARALKTIQEKHPDQMKKVSAKAILYIILDQDATLNEYVVPNWPDVQVLGSFRQFAGVAYNWDKLMPPEAGKFFRGPWMKENILEGHGPLCAQYEGHKGDDRDGDFRSEGDSPSFMHQIDVGLRSLAHPAYGGWGGRFKRDERGKCVWRGAEDDGDLYKPIWRWAEAFQNDWAARADWCVKGYDEANHPPVVTLGHAPDLKAEAGQTVELNAKGSKDPDGDALVYKWWQYKEPGTYKGAVAIENADQPEASFVVPKDAGKGETVHIICEVTDSGDPPLTRYQRVIVESSGG